MTAQPLSARVQPPSISSDSRAHRKASGVRAVLLGGLTVGMLDILDAIVFFGLYVDAPPIRILQSVAAGLLGRDAARAGGLPTAVLGGLLHFTIATIIATIYILASRRWRLLTDRAVVCGLAYGVLCYFVMSFVVVPLSAAGVPGRGLQWPALPVLLNGIIGHALLVGLPAALVARHALGARRRADRPAIPAVRHAGRLLADRDVADWAFPSWSPARAPRMTLRKFLLLAAVGPLLGVVRIGGLLASDSMLALPVRLDVLAWTFIGCVWWGLTLPFIVLWSERDPLAPGQLRRQIPKHTLLAVLASVASGLGIWASRWVETQWLGTPELTLRKLFANLLSSWLFLDLFMYAVALCVVSALAYQRRLRQSELDAARLETALVQTEIKLLKAELDPHFVFNALHTISALVHRDPAAADRMVCRLSDFLRLSLASTGAQEVTLQQELEHLQSYMEVQMVRFRGRLTLHVEVPPELLACRVPNLLLQPLVENVVKHAVAVSLKPVHATVQVQRAGGELEIEIADDGPGLPPPAADGTRREGIGLANTRARLRKLYGEAHRLLLADRGEGGARLLVALPYRLAAADAAADSPLEPIEELPRAAGAGR